MLGISKQAFFKRLRTRDPSWVFIPRQRPKPSKETVKHFIGAYVEEELFARLHKQAKQRRCSVSVMIRDILGEFFGQLPHS